MATTSVVDPRMVSQGAPSNGTNAVQTLEADGTVTAGTFRLRFEGLHTALISWNTSTAPLETVLNALPNTAAGGTGLVGVVVTGGAFPGTALVVTFSGSNVARKPHSVLVLDEAHLQGGGTIKITNTTPGVRPFGSHVFGGAAAGAQAIDGATGTVYYNSGSRQTPAWTAV